MTVPFPEQALGLRIPGLRLLDQGVFAFRFHSSSWMPDRAPVRQENLLNGAATAAYRDGGAEEV